MTIPPKPLTTYTPPAPYRELSLEQLMMIDLKAWQITKEAMKKAATLSPALSQGRGGTATS